MSKVRVFTYTAFCSAAADALGQPSHVRQVRAYVAATSRAAAARAFMAAGVLNVRSDAAGSRELATWGSEGGDVPVAVVTPGQVFVSPLNDYQAAPIAWPTP